MKKIKLLILLQIVCVFVLGFETVLAGDNDHIGKVKTVQPEANILRDDVPFPATLGREIFVGDVLTTEKDGTFGIIFRDGAILTLGPSSEFIISEYIFNPIESSTSFISKMKKGSASYISGAIGRINPESVRIETPTAYLGLRGTKILINVD